jgi:FixJ family two-component response regulator
MSALHQPPRLPLIDVVEPDEAVGDSLRLMLRAHGYEVRLHPDGASLFAALDGEGGCVVIGEKLPETSGLALAAAIRARGCTLPLVLMADGKAAALAAGAGAVGGLTIVEKPLLATRLLEVIGGHAAAGRPRTERS